MSTYNFWVTLEQGNDAKSYNWFFFKGAFNKSSKHFEKEKSPMVYPQRAAEGHELRGWKLGPGFPYLSHFFWCCLSSWNLKWADFPSSLEGGSNQGTGKHRQTLHPLQRVKHWPPLGTGRSLEHVGPDPGQCSPFSAEQGEAGRSCHSRAVLHFSSWLFQWRALFPGQSLPCIVLASWLH